MRTTSPAITPANTDRRTARNATKPQAMAPRRMPGGTAASVPGGSMTILAIAGEHRDGDRARPHEEFGLLVDPARDHQPEHPPDFIGQKADQHQQHIGMKLAAHLRASRR